MVLIKQTYPKINRFWMAAHSGWGHSEEKKMGLRTFLFCDVCNPQAIRLVEERRSHHRTDRSGRRHADGRSWFEGTPQEAMEQAGWNRIDDGRYICPDCAGRDLLDFHPATNFATRRA
jgi:hypothetical protein